MSTNVATVSIAASIETASLKEALDKLKTVVEKRNTIPILGNVMLTSDRGTLFMQATDLDVMMTVALPATVEAGMNITVPVHQLSDLVRMAPKGSITTLTPDAHHGMLIDFGGKPFSLHALPVTDFPHDCVDLKPGNHHDFTLAGADFWNGLDATQFAISTEETRYYLNGVYIHKVDGELRMVTTDGHRLAFQSFGQQPDVCIPGGAILPRKTAKVLHKFMKGKACPKDVRVLIADSVNTTRMRFEWDNITVNTKVIDGSFPDYPRVVPNDSYTSIIAKIDQQQMLAGLKLVTQISSERGRAVKLTFKDGSKLNLYVNNPDTGVAQYDLDVRYERLVELKEGASDIFEIGFNGQYLQNILETAGKGEIEFRFQDSGSPAKVTGPRSDWYSVLMPMRV
jgi:DNA polymerase-3 subunit beta